MPLCTLHLLHLAPSPGATPGNPLPAFLSHLSRTLPAPLLARLRLLSRVRTPPPVIRASGSGKAHPGAKSEAHTLNETAWDVLLLFEGGELRCGLSAEVLGEKGKEWIAAEYVLPVGVPGSVLQALPQRVGEALKGEGVPELMYDVVRRSSSSSSSSGGSSSASEVGFSQDSQRLEASEGLVRFALALIDAVGREEESDSLAAKGELGLPVWQLNLLRFRAELEGGGNAREEYAKYGKAFATTAVPFGGRPLLLGSVLGPSVHLAQGQNRSSADAPPYWHEVALAHYPSIAHFVDMSADGLPGTQPKDGERHSYAAINRAHRLPSLEDTTIICTTPVPVSGKLPGADKGAAAKL